MNQYVGTNYNSDGKTSCLPRIPLPASLAVLYESQNGANTIPGVAALKERDTRSGSGAFYRMRKYPPQHVVATEYAFRHSAVAMNIFFADGHVSRIRQNPDWYPEKIICAFYNGAALWTN